MRRPRVGARVKEAGEFVAVGIDTRKVWPLVPIAIVASQSKIIIRVCTSVLLCHNVFNVKSELIVPLMYATVFAAVVSSSLNSCSRFSVHTWLSH